MDARELVLNTATALFVNFDPEAARELLAPGYIQHNPTIPTGSEAILGLLPVLEQSGLRAEVHRVIAENDLVVLHTTYHNAQAFGAEALVAFDVFRVEDGKVAEHWDNLQPRIEETVSGNSMTDGWVEVSDLEKTAENKALVQGFVEDIFLGGRVDKLTDYISTEGYTQHNPFIGNDIEGLATAFQQSFGTDQAASFSELHMIVAEGNFVFTMTEGAIGATPTAFFDLFRVEGGKIVEHWDVLQEIPAEMAHDNGKF